MKARWSVLGALLWVLAWTFLLAWLALRADAGGFLSPPWPGAKTAPLYCPPNLLWVPFPKDRLERKLQVNAFVLPKDQTLIMRDDGLLRTWVVYCQDLPGGGFPREKKRVEAMMRIRFGQGRVLPPTFSLVVGGKRALAAVGPEGATLCTRDRRRGR